MIACKAFLAASLAAWSMAQQQASPVEIVGIRDGLYWIRGGSGANAGLIVTGTEAIVIDAKMTPEAARAMLAEIRKVTPNPARHVILTHSDGDHVNGLPGFPRDVEVIAHPNARRDMEQAAKDPELSDLAAWLPRETVATSLKTGSWGIPIELWHFGPAHTDGDLVVFLPRQRVAFVGDLIFIGREPLIHRHKNGNSFGLVQALKKLLELDADTYVSGHAEPVGKEEIRKLIASLETTQERVRTMVAQGRTLEEIKAAFGVSETSAAARRRPGLVEVVYLELTEKK
ncbi:MAG: MBL fold metallo-hydrolase [Bryobacteraceae bacterium]